MGDRGASHPWPHFFRGFDEILASVEAHHHQKDPVPLVILDDLILQPNQDTIPGHPDHHHRSL